MEAPLADAEPIASSGAILGVSIGMQMADVRARLDPLRAIGAAYEPDQKELQSRRVLWRLEGTEYEWLMVWANKEAKVTRVRARLRADKSVDFEEVGNLADAVAVEPNIAKWNLRTREGTNYRLVAQGTDRRAVSIYMFSLEIPANDEYRDLDAGLEN